METAIPLDAELDSDQLSMLKDFYLSFKYSQGGPELQYLLFNYIAKVQDNEMIQKFLKKQAAAFRIVSNMRPPKDHKPVSEENKEAEFPKKWDQMTAIFARKLNPQRNRNVSPWKDREIDPNTVDESSLILQSTLYMMARDLRETKVYSAQSPSFFREYVLRQQDPGSPIYARLFGRARDLTSAIMSGRVHPAVPISKQDQDTFRGRYQQVARGWEKAHPGQKFS